MNSRSLNTDDLLKLGWRVEENTDGARILVPCPTAQREHRLTSIPNASRAFSQGLSIAGYQLDDLIQESFSSLLDSLPSFKNLASLNTYSDRVVKNGHRNLLRNSKRDVRKANSETTSLVLDGYSPEGSKGGDHEVDLLKASQLGWNPGVVEEDRLDDLGDHALLALVDPIPDGLPAWWRKVDKEPWEVVAERMGVSPATAKRRVPPAWAQVLAIPEIRHIIETARDRRLVDALEIQAKPTVGVSSLE